MCSVLYSSTFLDGAVLQIVGIFDMALKEQLTISYFKLSVSQPSRLGVWGPPRPPEAIGFYAFSDAF